MTAPTATNSGAAPRGLGRWLVLSGATALVLAADQALKAWSNAHLRLYQTRALVDGWLWLTRFANGGLWGQRFSGGLPGENDVYIRYLPTAMLILLLAAFAWLRRLGQSPAERLGLALLFAGGLSNLADHWRSDFVIDSIRVRLAARWFVPCNLADLAIGLGAALIATMLARELVAAVAPSTREPARG